jgi:hypothetical protein
VAGALDRVASWWRRHGAPSRNDSRDAPADLLQAVERARQDYLAAQHYFQAVTEPALIDHAIHREAAAERHYMFLIRKARDEGTRMPREGRARRPL